MLFDALEGADFQIGSAMHRHGNFALAIGKDVVATTDPDHREPVCFQRFDDLFAVHGINYISLMIYVKWYMQVFYLSS